PKPAARVLRFQRAAELLVPTTGTCRGAITISEVAADCGYADQSHLVREFHALAGCTPTTYVTEWAAVVPISPSGPGAAGPTFGS
ncbi:MAG: AraC family transcriptional regulator, partial [Pseudonocardia sp.]|nr:AraC family transcriptional regulator [Pseudonocardia sp.]